MVISWGKNKVTLTKLVNGAVPTTDAVKHEFTNIVDGSTQLSTEKGDKMEALIEGGEAEAVKYKRSKYSLEFQYRLGSNRAYPLDGNDGVINDEYQVKVEAVEDDSAPNCTIARCAVSYEDTYTAEDGFMRSYLCESLKPETGKQITWDNVTTGG